MGCLNNHNVGPYGGAVHDIHVYNNTFLNCGKSGQNFRGGMNFFDSRLTEVFVKNNIAADSFNYQIGYQSSTVQSGDVIADYNLIDGPHSNSGGFIAVTGPNDIYQDPGFVTDSYKIDVGSPAIDACDNSVWDGIPNISDFEGNPITDGSGTIVADNGVVDCGAYEFISETIPPPPPPPAISPSTGSYPIWN